MKSQICYETHTNCNGPRCSLTTQYLDIYAVAGTTFCVRLLHDYNPMKPAEMQAGQNLGTLDYGSIDEEGQYIGDDDEIIEAARQEYEIDNDVPAGVR